MLILHIIGLVFVLVLVANFGSVSITAAAATTAATKVATSTATATKVTTKLHAL